MSRFPGWKPVGATMHTLLPTTVTDVRLVQRTGVWEVECTVTIGHTTVGPVRMTIEQARDADLIERVGA